MKNLTKVLAAGAVTGALTIGALGGSALASQGPTGTATVPYELATGPSATAENASLTSKPRPRVRIGERRNLRHLPGVHGETTVRTVDKKFATFQWQRGEITTASAGSITVKSADGLSLTWTLNEETKIRKNREKSASSALATGDKVFVIGQPDGESHIAIAVVVPKLNKE